MHLKALAFADLVYAFSDLTMGPLCYDGTDARVRVLASPTACFTGAATTRIDAGSQVGTLRFAADGRLVATLVADVPTG